MEWKIVCQVKLYLFKHLSSILLYLALYKNIAMKINIPKKFDDKLTGEYRAFIDGTTSNFSVILQDNKLEFFQEFTDHGIEHIEEVLNTACNLISDETFEHLNTKDIAVLIMAVILHDVGMHISEEGLKKILDVASYDMYRVPFFDKLSWKDKWDEFFYEAKRFNDEQLINIFGNAKVDIEKTDIENLDDTSRKLFGEFLRRHHARLAHEIAIGGFPTKIGIKNINTHTNIDIDIINLCGLVARSHGMKLRDSFDYLSDKHDQTWKTPYDIKVVFLMIVLRISDYIQIHSERANSLLVKTKKFSSPISKKEWEKHDSIKDISIKTADPERIFVTAKPENSLIYLELRKLFDDIQKEFDLSWAILGEVYGNDAEYKNLKIKFRRLTSNLDNILKFEKDIGFIPESIRFDADPELLKLLIGPLYGEDPKYGVRELLQNSVDAVKERSFIEDSFEQKIQISLEENISNSKEYYLTIKDNGIGMTKDTIINFFFRAGASFRNSMIWKKKFIEESEVKIEKTGRFGVGVLAAFLLGEEFELYTNHHNGNTGYYCKASLSTKQVELLKSDCEIGTFIKIKLSEKICSELLRLKGVYKDEDFNDDIDEDEDERLTWFNWYCMDLPVIEYNIKDNKLKKLFNFEKTELSSLSDTPRKGWYEFNTPDFKAIHWTIDNSDRRRYYGYNGIPKLYCNGFKVLKGFKIPDFPWSIPNISVFDGNAKMPLSLSRDYLLNDRLPFEDELVSNICRKIIEVLLETNFEKVGKYWIPENNYLEFLNFKINISEYLVVTGDKYTFMTPFIFESLNIDKFYQLWIKDITKTNYLFSDKKTYYKAVRTRNDPNYFYKNQLEESAEYSSLIEWFSLGRINNTTNYACNHFILNDKLTYMSEKNRLTKSFRENYKSQLFNQRWTEINKPPRLDRLRFTYNKEHEVQRKESLKRIKGIISKGSKIVKENLKDDYYYYVKEFYLDGNSLFSFDKFREIWQEIIGRDDFLIPIQKEYRKKI